MTLSQLFSPNKFLYNENLHYMKHISRIFCEETKPANLGSFRDSSYEHFFFQNSSDIVGTYTIWSIYVENFTEKYQFFCKLKGNKIEGWLHLNWHVWFPLKLYMSFFKHGSYASPDSMRNHSFHLILALKSPGLLWFQPLQRSAVLFFTAAVMVAGLPLYDLVG